MKSKNLLLGVLAIMLIFTMTAVGCGDDSTDNNGNGGGTDYWAKFKNTDWVKGTGTITFRESNQGKFMNFKDGNRSEGYLLLSAVTADKFIEGTHTIDYVLSNNGQTLTLSNSTGSGYRMDGEWTKR